jgi:hypothetical protein
MVIVSTEGTVQTLSYLQDRNDEPLIADLLEQAAAKRRERE